MEIGAMIDLHALLVALTPFNSNWLSQLQVQFLFRNISGNFTI